MPVRLTPTCRIAAALCALAFFALVGASSSRAASVPWGELGHFGTSPGELNSPQPAFGVNPEDGSAWAVDVSGEQFRIQKFEGGKVVASRTFGKDDGAVSEAEVEVEGVAFDPSRKRAYVLVTEERTSNPDKAASAAAELWAFSTSTSGGKIEFAPETSNGVLVARTSENLKGSPIGQTRFAPDDTEKTSPAPSLLDPSGIAVNPTNHQIIVTGWVGKAEKEAPTVWAISEKGKIEGDWEDKSQFFENCGCVNSPVVTSTGRILVLGEEEEGQGENVYQIPSSLSSSEPPKRAFWLPLLKRSCEILEEEAKQGKKVELCPFVERLTEIFAGSGALAGGEMTIGHEGHVYIHVRIPDIAAGETRFGGVMVLNSNLEEIGWTGGGSSESPSQECAVNESGEGGGGAALLGAGSESVLMYERGEPKRGQERILELGPGGNTSGCPLAAATAPSATVGGVQMASFPLADKITFSSEVRQANALSSEWEFEPGVHETVNARQQGTTRVEHKFAKAGTYTVVEKIHTDDLATPLIETSTSVTVVGPAVRGSEASVDGSSVTLEAEVDPNGQSTTCHFEYAKLSEALGGAGAKTVACAKAPGEGESYVAESVKVEQLPLGEYHFRLLANETKGEAVSFTIAEPLQAQTGTASAVAPTTATLNGTVDPGGHPTTCRFEYGMGNVSETSLPCDTEPGRGTGSVNESLTVSGLVASTTYKFRITAEDAEGERVSGSEATFETAERLAPTAETLGTASFTETTATVTGAVNPHGEATTCRFLYGPTTQYGQEAPCTTAPGSGMSPVGVTASISGLSPGVVYHYELVAENAVGPASGGDRELQTAPVPTVSRVSPDAGLQSGGASVTITGTNLAGATAVRFGSTEAALFTVDSPTSITATAPAGAGTVQVAVTTPGGTSADSPLDDFSYVAPGPAPAVAKLSAKKGAAAGGTSVTITGTGFTGVTAVDFGSAAAVSYEVTSATSITAVSPAGTTGTVDLHVTTPNGESATTSKDHFEFESPTVTGVSPAQGPMLGGTSVTVRGSGFALGTGATAFEFKKTEATDVDCTSSTECTAQAPAVAKAGVVDVLASVNGKTSKKTAADQYTYD